MKFKSISTAVLLVSTIVSTQYAAADESSGHEHKHHTSMQKGMSHDPHFIDMMSAHHEDEIKMAKMATEKAESKEIKEIANKVIKDQTKETEQLQGWHRKYFSSIPKTDEMPSKMDMSSLENLKGREFDQKFAEMMKQHHEQGVEMAKNMLPQLKNESVRTFAQNSVQKQRKEIEVLSKLQASLGQGTARGTGSTSEQ